MSDRYITSPVRLTGSVHPEQLSMLIAVDALRRKRAAEGAEVPEWALMTVSGDVAVQRAVQRAVAREGDDKREMGREGFAERARRHEADAAAELDQLLAALRIDVDTHRWTTSGDEASRAARVAFVRLYEAGALTRSEAVLDTCPSCQTVVDESDTDSVELEVEAVRLSIPLTDATLEIDVAQPELIVGAVAVAVPASEAPLEQYVHLPLLDAEVPIVAVDGLAAPLLVVPGHDSWSYDLAKQLNYPVIQVLDADGTVHQPGPLEGLSRYAARAAATEQLTVEGHVTATVSGTETVRRCYRCGTVLIPLLGRHWLLDFKQLTEPVIADVEAGQIHFDSPEQAAEFVDLARQAGSWSISQQLWTGHPIPVSTCLDCGATRVSVEEETSCGVCMGTLSPHDDVLDARFVAAVTPLAMDGWPATVERQGRTTLVVGRSGLFAWALPMACVGKRLTDAIPFDHLYATRQIEQEDLGPRPLDEMRMNVERVGTERARLVLAEGSLAFDETQLPVSGVDVAAAIEHLDVATAASALTGDETASPGTAVLGR